MFVFSTTYTCDNDDKQDGTTNDRGTGSKRRQMPFRPLQASFILFFFLTTSFVFDNIQDGTMNDTKIWQTTGSKRHQRSFGPLPVSFIFLFFHSF
jgi:hypothetical protein